MKVMDCQNEVVALEAESPYFQMGRKYGLQVASSGDMNDWRSCRNIPRDVYGFGPQARYDWRLGYDSAFGGYEKAFSEHQRQSCKKAQDETDRLTVAIILDRARSIVTGSRQTTHGKPERSFEHIAARWSLTLGVNVTPFQVALMMADMKQVRALEGVTEGAGEDHLVDMVGYIALAGEMR